MAAMYFLPQAEYKMSKCIVITYKAKSTRGQFLHYCNASIIFGIIILGSVILIVMLTIYYVWSFTQYIFNTLHFKMNNLDLITQVCCFNQTTAF